MTDTDEPQHRTYHQPDPDDVEVRDSDEEDDTFALRLPIVTTGEVRNEDDDPFEREALEGMAEQINDGQVPAFLDHGANSAVAGSRYSAGEKLGAWEEASVAEREDGLHQIEATAVLMEPETLPSETGALREALSVVKAQAERGVPIATSIGWSEDEDAPGGNDLWETSIVGIGADPRTVDDDVAVAAARDVLADADLEPKERERLVAEFRAVVMGSDAEGGNARDSVTDDDTNESGDEPDETHDEEQGEEETREPPEWADRMVSLLEDIHDAVRQDDEDDDDEDDDEEESDDDDEEGEDSEGDHDDEDEDEQSTQTVEIDGEERDVEDLVTDHQTALEELRANGVESDDLDIPEADNGQDAEGEGDEGSTDSEPSFSFTEDNE